MSSIYEIKIKKIASIISAVGIIINMHYALIIPVFAQTLEEKLTAAKITPEYLSFEEEIKSIQDFIKELDKGIAVASNTHNSARVSDLQHGKTQAVAYQTYVSVQRNYILEKMTGGEPPIKKKIQTLNNEMDYWRTADQSLDRLLPDKISGKGGGGGKIIQTRDPIEHPSLQDIIKDIVGENKITLTESEAISLRQKIHRRIAQLSSAIEAFEDIQAKGNQLPMVYEAEAKFLAKIEKLATERKEYPSYAQLRDFIRPSAVSLRQNHPGFISLPLPENTRMQLERIPGVRQSIRNPRTIITAFPDATKNVFQGIETEITPSISKLGQIKSGVIKGVGVAGVALGGAESYYQYHAVPGNPIEKALQVLDTALSIPFTPQSTNKGSIVSKMIADTYPSEKLYDLGTTITNLHSCLAEYRNKKQDVICDIPHNTITALFSGNQYSALLLKTEATLDSEMSAYYKSLKGSFEKKEVAFLKQYRKLENENNNNEEKIKLAITRLQKEYDRELDKIQYIQGK